MLYCVLYFVELSCSVQLGLPYYQLVLQILQRFAGGALVVTLWVEESMKEVEFHLLIQTRFQNPRTKGFRQEGFELNGLACLPSY